MYDLKINELILSSVTGVPGLSPAWVWGKYISGGKAQIWQGYDRLTQSRGTSDGVQTSEDIFVALCTSQKAFQAIRNNWNFPIEIFPPFLGKYCNISIFQKGICENTPFAKPRINTQIFVISPQIQILHQEYWKCLPFSGTLWVLYFVGKEKGILTRILWAYDGDLANKNSSNKSCVIALRLEFSWSPFLWNTFPYYLMSKNKSKAYFHFKQMFGLLFLQDCFFFFFFQTFPLAAAFIHFSGYC